MQLRPFLIYAAGRTRRAERARWRKTFRKSGHPASPPPWPCGKLLRPAKALTLSPQPSRNRAEDQTKLFSQKNGFRTGYERDCPQTTHTRKRSGRRMRETYSERMKNACPREHRERAAQDLISSEITGQRSPFSPSLLTRYPRGFFVCLSLGISIFSSPCLYGFPFPQASPIFTRGNYLLSFSGFQPSPPLPELIQRRAGR